MEEEEAEDDDDEDMEEMETGPISISTPIIDSGVPVANGVGLGAASGSGSGTGSSPGMGSVGSGSGTSVTPVGSPAMEVIEHGNGDTGEEEELYYGESARLLRRDTDVSVTAFGPRLTRYLDLLVVIQLMGKDIHTLKSKRTMICRMLCRKMSTR